MEIIYSLSEIDKVVATIWEQHKSHKVWAFNATMGSGKTTFIHALCKFLQVQDVVSSPTFSIINQYYSHSLQQSIYHIDAYRLKDEQEAIDSGVEDALYSQQICFVEWPSIIENLLPKPYIEIRLETINEEKRMLKIEYFNSAL